MIQRKACEKRLTISTASRSAMHINALIQKDDKNWYTEHNHQADQRYLHTPCTQHTNREELRWCPGKRLPKKRTTGGSATVLAPTGIRTAMSRRQPEVPEHCSVGRMTRVIQPTVHGTAVAHVTVRTGTATAHT